MKIILVTFLILFLSVIPGSAQEVYLLVMENATRTVNNPMSNYTQTAIAQFKITALNYIKQKAFETMPQVCTQFLDTQAYFLSEFLSLFMESILNDTKRQDQERKDNILLFMQASLSNPLFGDKDENTTQSYIKDTTQLTPFSLDTDWQKAYLAAKNTIK